MTYLWLAAAVSFLAALMTGTIVEYGVHRMMHRGKLLGKFHAEHHRDGWGQGVWGEFRDYFLGSLPVTAAGSTACYFGFDAWPGAAGFALGATCYAALAAYAHQLQHECPELVFWLRRPVHHLHHKHRMWKHNFGITFDFWDRVFGTYKAAEWTPERKPRDYPLISYLKIKWY